jgi:hypothetical protein
VTLVLALTADPGPYLFVGSSAGVVGHEAVAHGS